MSRIPTYFAFCSAIEMAQIPSKDPRDFSVGISGCARATLWQDASVLLATMHAGKVYPNVSPLGVFRCICFGVVPDIPPNGWFPEMGVLQNGWFISIRDNPIEMNDLGVPLFYETSKLQIGKC